jgi:hypothetical protein
MLQKYLIHQDGETNRLKISEYAIIGNGPKKNGTRMPNDDTYSLLCEESYEDAVIMNSISVGRSALIATLRTPSFFPIQRYATQIAESVMKLYGSDGHRSVELFFNDADLLMAKGGDFESE